MKERQHDVISNKPADGACIQPFGFLLTMSADWRVVHASENLNAFLGIEAVDAIGTPLDAIIDVATLHDVRNRLARLHRPTGIERLYSKALIGGPATFDIAVHYSEPLLILEGEQSGNESDVDTVSLVRSMLVRYAPTTMLDTFCLDAARQVRGLTGFKRVLVYRFGQHGDGGILAESLATGMPSFDRSNFNSLGMPPIRDRRPVSLIADAGSSPVAVLSAASDAAKPLDLSLATVQATPPEQARLLRAMGIESSLSMPIVIQGKHWGQIACHSATSRLPDSARRAAAELLGRFFSLALESRLAQSPRISSDEPLTIT